MSKIIGIDLGTTNSCFSVMEGGQATVIPNAEGNRTTPSVVGIKDSERFVGVTAKRQSVTNPKNTIFSAKRFIGRRHDEVSSEEGEMPFDITSGKDGAAMIMLDGKAHRPAEISAMVLQKIKADAEKYLGETVSEAVITVPAYFDDSQRQATKDAGVIAGFDVKRVINEPTAAALAYGLDKKKAEKVVVFDLGGGTFDVSILEISGDGTFEVLSTNGDTHLGGDDFDQVLIQHLVSEFKKDSGVDLSKDQVALQRLKDEAEKTKIELSTRTEVEVNIPFITADASGPKHLLVKITRADFEKLAADLIDRVEEPCRKAMKDAKLEAGDIDEVLMVGGMTRTPVIMEKVKSIFNKDPNHSINPDEVVALGAAIQGGVLRGDVKDVLLLDVTPLTLGIETMGGIRTPLIERNTTIPAKKSQIFSTAADNQPSVEIHVVQGEREMAAGNKSLGRFILDGIAPAPRGVPQIEVTFDIDASGILNVSAHDKGTGKKQNITIQGSSGMSDEEVEKLRKDAEEHAEEDKKTKELIEARNVLDSTIFQAEKHLKDSGDKVSAETKTAVEDELKSAREILAKTDASKDELETAGKSLGEKLQKIGEEIYKASSSAEATEDKQGSEAPKEGEAEKKEEAEEAEVVDEEKEDEGK